MLTVLCLSIFICLFYYFGQLLRLKSFNKSTGKASNICRGWSNSCNAVLGLGITGLASISPRKCNTITMTIELPPISALSWSRVSLKLLLKAHNLPAERCNPRVWARNQTFPRSKGQSGSPCYQPARRVRPTHPPSLLDSRSLLLSLVKYFLEFQRERFSKMKFCNVGRQRWQYQIQFQFTRFMYDLVMYDSCW